MTGAAEGGGWDANMKGGGESYMARCIYRATETPICRLKLDELCWDVGGK